jgi:CheY-like chemotaxis protein
MILESLGYQTRCLFDGPSVLPAAHQWHPDAIVLDIGLPGMSGLEVCAQLRREPRFQATPIVALTGYGQEEDRQRAQLAGFTLHMTKPADPLALSERLRSYLSPGAGEAAVRH